MLGVSACRPDLQLAVDLERLEKIAANYESNERPGNDKGCYRASTRVCPLSSPLPADQFESDGTSRVDPVVMEIPAFCKVVKNCHIKARDFETLLAEFF